MAHNRAKALTAAVAAFIVSFGSLVYATPYILKAIYGRHHNPADASVGDIAGWAMLLLSPVLVPAFLAVALFAAVIAYRAAVKRQYPHQ